MYRDHGGPVGSVARRWHCSRCRGNGASCAGQRCLDGVALALTGQPGLDAHAGMRFSGTGFPTSGRRPVRSTSAEIDPAVSGAAECHESATGHMASLSSSSLRLTWPIWARAQPACF